MIFPQYNYKEFNNSNKSEWVLQPPTVENWCKMVNGSVKYCNELTDVFEFIGHCEPIDLPSEHPYWKLQSFKRTIELIDYTLGFMAQTQRYIDSDGYHKVNAAASLAKQRESLKLYTKSLFI